MMPTPLLRRIVMALPVAVLALADPAPAGAAVIHEPSPGHVRAAPAWPAAAQITADLPSGAAGLGAAQGTGCTGCGEAPAAHAGPRRSPTLSVNVAILLLGSLWLALMLRRIQLRSAMAGLRAAAPQHAAGGH